MELNLPGGHTHTLTTQGRERKEAEIAVGTQLPHDTVAKRMMEDPAAGVGNQLQFVSREAISNKRPPSPPATTGGGPKPEETCSSWIYLRLSLG